MQPNLLLVLDKRIHDELSELEWVVSRIQEGWIRARKSADDFYLDSVAMS